MRYKFPEIIFLQVNICVILKTLTDYSSQFFAYPHTKFAYLKKTQYFSTTKKIICQTRIF